MSDTNNQSAAAIFDLVYLLGCAVNETVPRLARVEKMDLERVYALSRFHSLTAITCMALETAYGGHLPETELFRRWTEAKNRAIYKNLLFDVEREQVLAFLEESGLWYMPLKGILLKDLYPKQGMRQMADNDILFDAAGQKQVHDWFLRRVYTAEEYHWGNHDIYHKKPVYNFEMHKTLFGSQHNPVWQDYYANIQDRMIRSDGSRYGYHLSDEDFYLYITTHSCKHYSGGGTGLRSLLDCYVYNRARGDGLNRSYIHAELEKLGIAAFEEEMRTLGQTLFAQPEQVVPSALTEAEAEMLFAISSSGTHGTLQKQVSNALRSMEPDGPITGRTKLRYLWKRLFPDLEELKNGYPFFFRYKWLLPIGYLYRLVYRGIKSRKKLLEEAKSLRKL